MNLILVDKDDYISSSRVRLSDLRYVHIKEILKSKLGDKLSVGLINGLIGQGKITLWGKNFLELDLELTQKPPKSLKLTVIMALVRPPMLKRSLSALASLGVKEIVILNFSKVEKSLWQSSALKVDAIQEELRLGLSQSKDTILPKVTLEPKFKPFVDDRLPALIKGKKTYIAHPGKYQQLPKTKSPAVLILGPEGGITDFEFELFKSKGAIPATLGTRILRFETALVYSIGRINA